MREILFRAKSLENSSWATGCYHTDGSSHYILKSNGEVIKVDPNTLCEYTGFKDRYGNRIFEHDIVHFDFYWHICKNETRTYEGKYEVVFEYGEIKMINDQEYLSHCLFQLEMCVEIIGNIFDNPELAKEIYVRENLCM